MNTFIRKIFTLCLFIASLNSVYSQTVVDQVSVNNQTIVTNCNTINFGTTSSNSLVFYYTLTDAGQPSGTIKILLKYDSGSFGNQKTSIPIQTISWSNNKYISTIACTIGANEVQVNGSSIVLEFETSSGIKTRSCEYPIIKTPVPSFSLNPTSVSIACGNTSARTFSVAASNIPAGANVTYSWNYSGWTGVNTSTNSITLTPSSGTSLPSNVSVTPFINGVAQASLSSVVTRSVPSNGSIVGNTIVCSSMGYSFSGLLSGQTVSWSLSNTTSGTLSNTTGTTTTFTATSIYPVNLIATILDSCGSTFTKSVVLSPGGPFMSGLITGPTCVRFGQRVSYAYVGSASNGDTAYQWSADAPIDDNSSFNSPSNCSWKNLSLQGTSAFTFKAGCIPATVVIRVTVNSPCAPRYAYLYVTVNATGNCGSFRVANIQQENGNLASYLVEDDENASTNKIVDLGNNYQADIYDLNGIKVKEFKTNDYEVSDLKAGIYIIKLFYNDNFYTSKFIVN